MVTSPPAELEMACQLIERLELHRRCLDEALADAYTELLQLLQLLDEPGGLADGG